MSARRFDRELGALREELAASRRAVRPPDPPAPPAEAEPAFLDADLARLEADLRELAEAVEAYAAEAGEAFATRPLVLIGTAFLAGVVAGHGLRRG